MRPTTLAIAALVALQGFAAAAAQPVAGTPTALAPRADAPTVLRVSRPAAGEWYGLYLMGKKAGYAFSQVREGDYQGRKAVVALNTLTLRVGVGAVQATRSMREEKVYEYRDGGRLLAFTVEKRGDGGDETLVGTCARDGIRLVRKRPGMPDEVRQLPPTGEVVENADAPRLVAAPGKRLEGKTLDLEDTLADKQVVAEYVDRTTFVAAGLSVPAVRTRLLEERMKVPTITTVAEDGRTVEMRIGEIVAKAEEEQTAKQLDHIDLFNLTRVVLDKPIPKGVRGATGQLRYVVQGLTRELRYENYRQHWADRPDGSALLTVAARLPKKRALRPVAGATDPEVKEALQTGIAVESDAPEIVATSRRVVGDERDAWAAARKINAFVNGYLAKEYGASSDRATAVLAAKKGDCTEHALLATALARAAGVPARRVEGLVYMDGDGTPALYWHEWVEVWVGQWVAMDPTFDQPVADATHIAVGREGRSDTAALIGQIRVSVAP